MSKKLALVTGGGGGIGAAICERADMLGYRVGVVDQHLDTAHAFSQRLRDGRAEQLDVTDEAAVQRLFDRL